jgi:hypothetical protein
MDDAIQNIFLIQSQTLATLALRISVLEQLLLEKKVITNDEILKKMQALFEEFSSKTQQAMQDAIKSVNV